MAQASRSRRGPPQRQPHQRRAHRTVAAPRRKTTQAGAGDPLTSRGLVRSGDEGGSVEGFRISSAHSGPFIRSPPCAVCWTCPPAATYAVGETVRRRCAHERDAALVERMGAVPAASHGTYGSPRVHAELVEGGLSISRKRVARLMKRRSRRRQPPPFCDHDRARWRPPRRQSLPAQLCSRRARMRFGLPTLPTFQPVPAFSTSPSCSTPSAGGIVAGRLR